MPSLVDSRTMKPDECPHLLLTVVCDAHNSRRCCPRYIAEVGGNLGSDVARLRFNWTLSTGKIINGQGTPGIRVDTKSAKGTRIVVQVRVEGLDNWPNVCPKQVSLAIDCCKERRSLRELEDEPATNECHTTLSDNFRRQGCVQTRRARAFRRNLLTRKHGSFILSHPVIEPRRLEELKLTSSLARRMQRHAEKF